LPEDVEIIEHNGEATSLLAHLEAADAAVVVDACCSGGPAGTVYRFDVSVEPLPEVAFGVSTHGFGVGMTIELARALKQLPARCIVFAIEGTRFDAGAGLSAPVATALFSAAARVRGEFLREDDAP
jgi:hydrogenase maturation protease